MAASETVRLRLRFDYPPPATPNCMDFWLLVDLNRCRVVTDLISLIRQRFGFSSGAILSLYLEGGLLPHGESARLVRDNDCLRVKLEEREVTENPVVVSNGDSTHFLPRKAKKRSFKLEEDEETDYRNSKKQWKRRENNNENTLDPEPKAVTDQSGRGRNKRKHKATLDVVDEDDKETKRKSPKKKEKCAYRKQTKNPKSSKAQTVKEWTVQKCSPPKGSPARNSLVKAKRKGGVDVHAKDSPSSSSESESCHDSASEHLSNVILEVRKSSEKVSTALLKEGPSINTTANKVATKIAFNSAPIEDKTTRTSDSSSDSSSDSDDQSEASKSSLEKTAGPLKPNPVRTPKKDYSLLPLLAAAPQIGEKIAFKLLELTPDYSPDVSDYKEGKILSHNPETQQVDIEILSSTPVSPIKEPGKFDLVYHNENGSEVVEYAVTQERKITVFWRQLIDPRLIVESPSNNTSSTELA
ncbi:Coilin [Myotis brandtii]|uniref:Coilin n=1 Tax=Myotis brandtii TaxID=109478 RepID=S7N3N7_MYOBR|nr:Coilin [Myotis brandtii]